MKTILKAIAVVVVMSAGTSCMTTYDAYGRPVQSVDPGAAAVGAAAAGVAGYAIGRGSRDDRRYHRGHYHRPYYPRRGYYYR